ncbi:PilZ domain-containing protein [Acidithiobacillus sp. CV18-2]|uniref:PilZ domain-containing protein n=1 Tax=Acidithiobacillus caldus TaxID=33059 RepID=UPI001C0787D2|nr:PilZ domain-containing protein [Acidithiobacillus caldus]MBU2753439.1 PilZ domain-containing protein [Acidithiobacillus sp. CV18-3]MBU2756291.1 PilZ domain-containing protein [Acidithiobacillus sp. BN09-2]MBU2776255.1 PilZ domain-containing protein [Acidithiobacillus sp. CV18-2]MBU2800033.1 PilZ domain-containing protein [Acidithiobacillus sp. VAN18-4]MBU2763731.1 PilZ domain-containing protein [Acidithiobacillus caldus]
MSLSDDDTELALMIPHRGDLPLVDLLPLAFLSGYEELLLPNPEDLHLSAGNAAIFYTPESGDNGTLCHVRGWEGQELLLEPMMPALGEEKPLRKPLFFVLARPRILGFFADWKHSAKGMHYFAVPTRALFRNARSERRVKLDGNILLRAKDGRAFYGKLHDFSPSGASLFLDRDVLAPGEVVLAEFEIPECGICETIVTIARQEHLTHPLYPYLYGIHFELTENQKRKAEHLYLCKKGEQIQQVINSSRDRFSGKLL